MISSRDRSIDFVVVSFRCIAKFFSSDDLLVMPAGLFSSSSSNCTATVPISCKFVITSSWGSPAAVILVPKPPSRTMVMTTLHGESYATSNFDHHIILNADLVCLILVRGTVGCCCAVWNSVLRRCCLRVAVSHQPRRNFHLHFRCRSGEH
jgi:hypothetical protein